MKVQMMEINFCLYFEKSKWRQRYSSCQKKVQVWQKKVQVWTKKSASRTKKSTSLDKKMYKSDKKKYKLDKKKYKSKLKWIKLSSYFFQIVFMLNFKFHLFQFDDLQLLFVSFLIFGQYVINIFCSLIKL